jgi:N-methylhydantoinase A
VVGARDVAAACGIKDVITVDIGGTSADICLIKDGRIALTQQGHVGEWPLPLPMVDMVTIGAGGGSIAKVEAGTLTVGPQSAGAEPGPAAYGRGGRHATVTDAHVILGHLPAKLLGGRMALDVEAAASVIDREVATPLGLDRANAARGILSILDHNMVGAVRIVSVERGHDPREFTLVAFGGAGPLHGCSLAALLGITRVLVPPAPGVLCADGLLAADLRAEFSRTLPKAGAVEIDVARKIFAELTQAADDWLTAEKVASADRQQNKVAMLRYHGQGGEVAVPWDDSKAGLEAAFAAAHQGLYGFTLEAAVELVTLRVEATGRMPSPPRPMLAQGSGAKPGARFPVHLASGVTQVPLYDRARLGAGDMIEGPAIISQLDATTLVLPGWTGEVHPSGAILLRR